MIGEIKTTLNSMMVSINCPLIYLICLLLEKIKKATLAMPTAKIQKDPVFT